jgi:hypothetical protein
MADLTEDQIRQQEDEEFEFRARAEQEARSRQQSSQSAPANTGAGPVAPGQEPSLGTQIVGGLKTAYDVGAPIVAEHPIATGYAASYVPGVNRLPIIRDIKNTREAVGNIAKRGANIASNFMGGGTPPAGGPVSPGGVQMTGVGSPNAPIGGGPGMAQAAGAAENVGAQAAGRTGMMQDLTKLYQKYGPALIDQVGQIGKAIGNSQIGQMAGAVAESPVGRLAGGALRVAGSAPVMGAQLGLYSSGLNQGEDEQMRQIHQQQDALRLKQNKTAPNAINSGFSQQLNSYSQQRRPQ